MVATTAANERLMDCMKACTDADGFPVFVRPGIGGGSAGQHERMGRRWAADRNVGQGMV